MTRWVVAYDIRSHRRRARVARRLEQVGLRVQKSVFVLDKSAAEVRKLIRELGALIDPHADQVAAWRLGEQPQACHVSAGLPLGPLYQETVVW